MSPSVQYKLYCASSELLFAPVFPFFYYSSLFVCSFQFSVGFELSEMKWEQLNISLLQMGDAIKNHNLLHHNKQMIFTIVIISTTFCNLFRSICTHRILGRFMAETLCGCIINRVMRRWNDHQKGEISHKAGHLNCHDDSPAVWLHASNICRRWITLNGCWNRRDNSWKGADDYLAIFTPFDCCT